ncbi:hypothetical protein AGLY_006665 [Aphis glycines]|uniref:Uncharacterized protein n=1 Tax=Aphis glycines TaxID=307491 RepID=A0A6G0TS90_APHGL|nr:hypothetical protein AGLY_006665 [Aphis glycines]
MSRPYIGLKAFRDVFGPNNFPNGDEGVRCRRTNTLPPPLPPIPHVLFLSNAIRSSLLLGQVRQSVDYGPMCNSYRNISERAGTTLFFQWNVMGIICDVNWVLNEIISEDIFYNYVLTRGETLKNFNETFLWRLFKSLRGCTSIVLYTSSFYDSERSDECIEFTMIVIPMYMCISIQTIQHSKPDL